MYNIKKNSCRKEGYKFKKPGYLKKRQNTAHFQYNKYNKYKQRYSYSNKFSNYSYENNTQNNTFFEKDSEIFKQNKKNDLIEINESKYTYEDENKEISSSYENSITNEYIYQEKTNEKTDGKNNDSFNNMQEDKSLTMEQDLNSTENNTIIIQNQNSFSKVNSHIYSDDKENLDPNFNNYNNINNINYSNITAINLSSQDFKEAFYVPKRLNNLYNMYSNNNKIVLNIKETHQNENSFQNLSSNSIKEAFSLNNITNINNNNNFFKTNSQNINSFTHLILNNNNNNHNLVFCKQNFDLNINKTSSIDTIQPFNLYDSHNSNSFRKMNSFDSFHSSLKAQINRLILENEKEKENTDILEIYVKLQEQKTLIFKIRRYDDMFKTVKIFCEINNLDIK